MLTFRSNKCVFTVLLTVAALALSPTAYAKEKYPPKYWVETALKIGKCEQPSGRQGKWAGVNWTNTANYSFKGGLGMTNALWDQFKKKWYPEDANEATPMQQIIVAWRFYKWAEDTYPNAGYTGWECSSMIGFYGFKADGTWK